MDNKEREDEQLKGIYSIECIENKSIYIGESFDIYKRWNEHKTELQNGNHHNYHMQSDYNTYGLDSFKFSILQTIEPSVYGKLFDKALLIIYEHIYINLYKKRCNVYNIQNTLEAYLNDTKPPKSDDDDKFMMLIRMFIVKIFKHYLFNFVDNKIQYCGGICVNEYLYNNRKYTHKYRDIRQHQVEHIIKYLSEINLPDYIKVRNIKYVNKGVHYEELILITPIKNKEELEEFLQSHYKKIQEINKTVSLKYPHIPRIKKKKKNT